jgi:hypothetical protein
VLTIVCFLPMAYFVIGPVFGWPTGNMVGGI